MRYTERLAAEGAATSVGSKGDSFHNAMAESFHGLYEWELIYPQGPWSGLADVEFATLTYVDWFNHRRLHGEIEPGPGFTTPPRSKPPTTVTTSPPSRQGRKPPSLYETWGGSDRMQRLWTLASRAQQTVVNPSPQLQRRVLDLVDLHVQVTHWDTCQDCHGRGFVSAGHPSRSRTRGATGISCPTCHRHRHIPAIEIRGVIPDTTQLDPTTTGPNTPSYPFHIKAS